MSTVVQSEKSSLPEHILLDGISWNYYEQLLAEIGDRHIRVTYNDGMMEIDSPFLEDISWDFYEQTLAEIGNRPIRVTYCDGRMEIMSPLPRHENAKKRIAQMLEMLSFELGMPRLSLASTTYRRKELAKGLEPDECYYFQSAAKLRNVNVVDLTIDPPPDLAIEIDITSHSQSREPIYAALGVPELWRFDGVALHCLHLKNSKYEKQDRSLAFPFLNPAELLQFLTMDSPNDETPILRAFMAWVRKNGWV